MADDSEGRRLERPTHLQRLLDEPKGKVEYRAGEAFLLQVFWEAPTEAAARELLAGLRRCAEATHRDTPCVPTYIFRLSNSDASLYGSAPTTVGEHPQLSAAIKKLQVGIPRGAVAADLGRRGLDPAWLDLEMTAPLPAQLQGQLPVAVELTEVYLDERAFMEHTGSRDFLDAYGRVMEPRLQNKRPVTLRAGTPSLKLLDTILEPILQAVDIPLLDGCTVWKGPPPSLQSGFPLLLSLDFDGQPDAGRGPLALPTELTLHCTTAVLFAHPLRPGTLRLLLVLVLPLQSSTSLLAPLAALHPARGEAHVTRGDEAAIERVRASLIESGLEAVTLNGGEFVGYALHERVAELRATGAIGTDTDRPSAGD